MKYAPVVYVREIADSLASRRDEAGVINPPSLDRNRRCVVVEKNAGREASGTGFEPRQVRLFAKPITTHEAILLAVAALSWTLALCRELWPFFYL